MKLKKKPFRSADLFLLLLVVFGVLGMLARIHDFRKSGAGTDLSAHTVIALWQDVPAQTALCVSEGERLYTNAGETIGKIRRMDASPAEVILSRDGEVYRGTLPAGTREDLTFSLEITGTFDREGAFRRSNGAAILLGETYELYSDRARLLLTVLEIQ